MKKSFLLFVLSLIVSVAHSEGGQDTQILLQDSHKIIKQFSKSLKGELSAAIKNGGPANGIHVCNEKALDITLNVAKENGVTLSRTSLKVRNPDNTPKPWEKSVLEHFEKRKSLGESPKKMEFSEVVENDGKKQFRYMKAIGTEQVCLTCHGEKVAPDVESKLSSLYPNDQARGYKVGDIRGAIVLIKAIEE